MTEYILLRYCAPTLAGMKTANLFRHMFASKHAMIIQLQRLNQQLHNKGLRIIPLHIRGNAALLYLYRPAALNRDFQCNECCRLMRSFGYCPENPTRCLVQLMQRLRCNSDFPHEIGLFLGYPPEDVQGFMEHRPCKYAGCWKVYGNVERSKHLFEQYRKCTAAFLQRWYAGESISKLAVAL